MLLLADIQLLNERLETIGRLRYRTRNSDGDLFGWPFPPGLSDVGKCHATRRISDNLTAWGITV